MFVTIVVFLDIFVLIALNCILKSKCPNGHRFPKVEFIQPFNWLYSVPNLLVIQYLVTLYLGGFDVRVVSEIE